MTCRCEPDLDETRFARRCDYCGTTYADARCEHDAYQQPCPECAVSPVAQLA
jgi:hypothetical protein